MVLGMQDLYTALHNKHGANVRNVAGFSELRELAKRFSIMFGLDALRNREPVAALHRAGISFAAAHPDNLPFLEALTEFCTRLLRQDKRTVLRLLDSRISLHPTHEHWGSLQQYRTALLTDPVPEERPPPAKRAYTRRTSEYPFVLNSQNTRWRGFLGKSRASST